MTIYELKKNVSQLCGKFPCLTADKNIIDQKLKKKTKSSHTIENSILERKKSSKNVGNILNYHVDRGEKLIRKNAFKVLNFKRKEYFSHVKG